MPVVVIGNIAHSMIGPLYDGSQFPAICEDTQGSVLSKGEALGCHPETKVQIHTESSDQVATIWAAISTEKSCG